MVLGYLEESLSTRNISLKHETGGLTWAHAARSQLGSSQQLVFTDNPSSSNNMTAKVRKINSLKKSSVRASCLNRSVWKSVLKRTQVDLEIFVIVPVFASVYKNISSWARQERCSPVVLTVTTSLNGPVPSLFCANTLNWYSVPGSSPGTTNHV